MNPDLLAERVEGVIVSIGRRHQLHSLAEGIIDKTGRGGAARRRGRLSASVEHPDASGYAPPALNASAHLKCLGRIYQFLGT